MNKEVLLSAEVETLLNLSEIEIKTLSSSVLFDQTQVLVREERRIGVGILNRLREIGRRHYHLELGYSSLYTFLTGELKYPEATAYRLVSTVEIMRAVPEVENKIRNGDLSVSTISQVQSYIKAQGRENSLTFTIEEKKEILKAVEGQSSREAEKTLVSLHPEHPLNVVEEKARPVAGNQTLIQLLADDELMKMLSRIKDLSAHQDWNPSYADLFKKLAQAYLDKHDPVIKAERVRAREEKKTSNSTTPAGTQSPVGPSHDKIETPESLPTSEVKTRYIPAHVKRSVHERDQGRCAYVSKITSRQCKETKGLQIDHRKEWALGGSNHSSNLRLLCQKHNYWAAVKTFGAAKMQSYVKT